MAIKLHRAGYDHAVSIIKNGLEIEHTGKWNQFKPKENSEARFLETHSLDEYGSWFLGVDDSTVERDSRKKFSYPFGDFNVLHVSALDQIIEDATRHSHADIKKAAEELLALINKKAA